MIGANELTGDARIEEAGQWQNWLSGGPLLSRGPSVLMGICLYTSVCVSG